MFDSASPRSMIGELEECQRQESTLIARRMSAIAALLWHRSGEAEDAPCEDPGYALITGFARTCAEVSAAMNMSPMAPSQMVGHAEALDTRLPKVARLLAQGRIDWRTVQLIITRTALVHGDLMAQLDQQLTERITSWQCWSRRRIINAVDAAVRAIDPAAAKERRVTADNARHLGLRARPPHHRPTSSRCAARTRRGRTLACDCGRLDCPRRAVDQAAAPPRFVINVIASQETLTGCSEQPGYLEGYGVIDADQVRQLAESAILRLLSEPEVSDAAALRYQPTAALERWIRCRDLTCCFPGCDRPAWGADIDHTIAFNHTRPSAGGLTVPGNNKCYCRQHHRLKTFHGGPDGWQEVQLPDGTIVLTSPTGRVYRNTPAGTELFPQLRPACAAPTPRKRSRRREKAARTALARNKINAHRPSNAETRRRQTTVLTMRWSRSQ